MSNEPDWEAMAKELLESLQHAVAIIDKHVPQDALGFNGDDARPDWPILDEYMHYMNDAISRAQSLMERKS